MAATAGCRHSSTAPVQAEAASILASAEKFYGEYVESIDAENKLISLTISWLHGDALTAARTHALSDARRLTDRWARVYFVPRHMHEKLRFDEYSSTQVKGIQRQMLAVLKRRYFELHEFQRYAQRSAESEIQGTPAGRLPQGLLEFRNRLEARTPAIDEIGPMLTILKSMSGAA
jgi:hypothetical protein